MAQPPPTNPYLLKLLSSFSALTTLSNSSVPIQWKFVLEIRTLKKKYYNVFQYANQESLLKLVSIVTLAIPSE